MKLVPFIRYFAASLVLLLAFPLRGDEQRAKAPGAVDPSRKVDLNTADLKTLAAVPAIGPDLARAIVAARPFATINDLDRVRGISAEQLEAIRTHAYVSTPPAKTRLGEPTREKKPLGSPTTAEPRANGRLDINTADEQALAAVPAIGPELARAIVAARPFKSLDELSRVRGLTAEQLEQVRAALTISPGASRAKK